MRQTKTVRTQQNTCNAQTRKVTPFCHLTRKGPLLEKISKHLSDLTGMGPFLKKKNNVISQEGTAPNHTDCCVISQEGTAPNHTDCCVISQEGDRSLKNKLLCHLTRKGLLLKQTKTPTKLSQQITKCEWISGTLSQHVAWLCDSRF